MNRLAKFLMLGALIVWAVPASNAAAQQADPRDSEGAYFAPSNTLAAHLYVRHISSMESPTQGQSTMLGLVRGTYLLKFGNITFTPLDFFIPVVDTTVYNGPTTLHLSGLGDPRYLPTIALHLTQDAATLTHTWISLTTYLQLPFGQYNELSPANIGENRFSVQPVLTIGQRLAKILTIEGFFGAHFLMDNEKALAVVGLDPTTMAPMFAPSTLSQEMGINGGAHVAVDLSKTFNLGFSYLFTQTGAQTHTFANGATLPAAAEGTNHELRVTMAVNVAPTTTLRLQWAEGLARDGSASRDRYIGLRFSHAVFLGDPPPGAAPAPASPPPPPPPAAEEEEEDLSDI